MPLFFKYRVVDIEPGAHLSLLCHKSLVTLSVLRNIVVLGMGDVCLYFSALYLLPLTWKDC